MEGAGGDMDDDSGGTVAAVSQVGGRGGRAGLWGLRLKRIAIAGAAITSAPVVLPPLLLLSAVGLAFSVPMGVFLAGYACTDKIMRSLLPLPALSPAARQPPAEEDERGGRGGVGDEEGEEEEVGGREEWVGRAREEEGGPVEEEPPEAEEEREEKRTVEWGPGPVSEGEGKRVTGKQAVQEEEECGFPTSEADQVAVCDAAPDREEKRAQAEEEEQGKEGGIGIALAGAGERKISASDQEEEKQVEEEVAPFGTEHREAVDKATLERRHLKEVGEATVLALVVEDIIISAPPPEVEGEHVEEEELQEAIGNQEMEGLTKVPVERVEGESITATEREELAEACSALGHPAALERGSLIEPSRLAPESAYAVEEQVFGSVEHRELQRGSPAVSISPDSVEDSYNEEKTWEQINALRAIVGYKAPPRSSCMEELKALYLLMGVEPVVSSQESSSLEDVNSKLRFLKSIIGVE